jgi:hypothetical protein
MAKHQRTPKSERSRPGVDELEASSNRQGTDLLHDEILFVECPSHGTNMKPNTRDDMSRRYATIQYSMWLLLATCVGTRCTH